MVQICRHCGDSRDTSPHGLRQNLGKRDDGNPGGLGWCGDSHQWEEMAPPTRKVRKVRDASPLGVELQALLSARDPGMAF